MRTKQLQLDLIELLDKYESEAEDKMDLSIEEFAYFILHQEYSKGQADGVSGVGDVGSQVGQVGQCGQVGQVGQCGNGVDGNAHHSHDINIEIAKALTCLARYIKFYMQKALKDSPLQTIDESTYLMTLMSIDSLNKTELNNFNVCEKTTGNEIIKRLLRKGLVTEFDDPTDKRSKRVRISEQGIQTMRSVLPALKTAAIIASSPLSTKEKKIFLHYLNFINEPHRENFLNHRNDNLEEIDKKL